MYVNYGDKNFFERGRLVDAEHEEHVFHILCCDPYPDEPDQFRFGECEIDITDSWINREGVMSFISMTEETYDPVRFALGCLDYYSWENFGVADYCCGYGYNWLNVDRETILKVLSRYLIACDGMGPPELMRDTA